MKTVNHLSLISFNCQFCQNAELYLIINIIVVDHCRITAKEGIWAD